MNIALGSSSAQAAAGASTVTTFEYTVTRCGTEVEEAAGEHVRRPLPVGQALVASARGVGLDRHAR